MLRREVEMRPCRLLHPVVDQFQFHHSYVHRTQLSPESRRQLSVDHAQRTESLDSHGLETYARTDR